MNTVFLATILGMAGSRFGLTTSTPLARPLVSAAGVASIGRNAITQAGPVLLGLFIGVQAFGSSSELYNLVRNAPTYSREFKAI